MREDELDRERYLFYVCASRAERALFLSSRFSDEEGNPAARLVLPRGRAGPVHRDRAAPALAVRRRLGPPEDAPTEAEWERALAALAARARRPPVPDGAHGPRRCSRGSRSRDAFSASALETFADCPVKWLVDRLLAPRALEPDPEAMVRGRYAHEVLERHLRPAARGHRLGRVTRGNLADAERILREALRDKQRLFLLSP